MKIEFDWSVDYIDNTTDELFPADKLNRAEYAKFLTQFLAKQGFDGTQEPNKQKKNYVLNLNAEWGAGKSYFLKRWSNDLKKHYPVVYIDVWKQDYSNDPLLTIVSAMTKQLKEQAGSNNTAINVPESISNLFKAALPSVANALAAKYLGLNISSLIESVEKADISEYDNIETGAIAQKITETLIKEHENKEKSIDILKLNIKEWVEAVVGQSATTENKKYYPAFIFIDELDRCKPSYAVEVLETIKHIFDIPGVIFVVATNTNQLQHTIKSVYGDGFDAIQYLGRFFNTRFAFGSQSFEKLLSVHCEISKLSNEYLSFKNISTFPDSLDQNTNGHIALKNLTTVYDTFLISSRQAIQITNRLIGIIDNNRDINKLNIIYLAFLMCVREKDPSMYRELLQPKPFNSRYNNNNKRIDEEITKQFSFKYQTIEINSNGISIDYRLYAHKNALIIPLSGLYTCSLYDFILDSHEMLIGTIREQTKANSISTLVNALTPHKQNNQNIGKLLIKAAISTFDNDLTILEYKNLVETGSL